jgi:hypothetical protein
MDQKIDIELGLISSTVTIKNLQSGLTKVIPMFTKDLFEAISQKYAPLRLTKSAFFQTNGTEYGALKHFRESPNGKLLVITETSRRLGDFHGSCRETSGLSTLVAALGPTVKEFFKSGECKFPIYWPNLIQTHVFKRDAANNDNYRLSETYAAWSDNTILDENAEIYSFTLPNLYALPGHNQHGAFAKTCWGSTINLADVTPGNCTSLGFAFEDSFFNGDLSGSSWYGATLPFLVAGNPLSTSVGCLAGKFLDLETLQKIEAKLNEAGVGHLKVKTSSLKESLNSILNLNQ